MSNPAASFEPYRRRLLGLAYRMLGSMADAEGMEIGRSLELRRCDWKIVGVFDAAGSGFESEIWGDVDVIGPAFNRGGYHSVTLRMHAPSTMRPQCRAGAHPAHAARRRGEAPPIAFWFPLGQILGYEFDYTR